MGGFTRIVRRVTHILGETGLHLSKQLGGGKAGWQKGPGSSFADRITVALLLALVTGLSEDTRGENPAQVGPRPRYPIKKTAAWKHHSLAKVVACKNSWRNMGE